MKALKALWDRLLLILKRVYRRIMRASGSPHEIALGVAVGFFVGWLPIVGMQMVVAIAVCTLLKCNRIVPIFPIWLTNPVTLVPIYSFNYWVGWLVVGGPGIGDVREIIGDLVPKPSGDGVAFLAAPLDWIIAWCADFWGNIKHNVGVLLELGWEAQLPLWLGCALVGLALAAPSYYLVHFGVRRFWEAISRKRQRRHERLAARLKRRSGRITRRLLKTDNAAASAPGPGGDENA